MENNEIRRIVSEFVLREGLSDFEVNDCFGKGFEICSMTDCPILDSCKKCSKLIGEQSFAGAELKKSPAIIPNESVAKLVHVQNIQGTKDSNESEVNESLLRIKQYEAEVIKNFRGIGFELIKIKKSNPGNFLKFCNEKLGYSLDTAENFMRIARRFGEKEFDEIGQKLNYSSLMLLSKKKYDDNTVNTVINEVKKSNLKPKYVDIKKFLSDNELNSKVKSVESAINVEKVVEKFIKDTEYIKDYLEKGNIIKDGLKEKLAECLRNLLEKIEISSLKTAADRVAADEI